MYGDRTGFPKPFFGVKLPDKWQFFLRFFNTCSYAGVADNTKNRAIETERY